MSALTLVEALLGHADEVNKLFDSQSLSSLL